MMEAQSLRQAVLRAAAAAADEKKANENSDEEGLVTYLKHQALAVPGSFLTLLGKVVSQKEEADDPPITRIELVAPTECKDG